MKYLLFAGRFQPFHKGHLEAIKMILKKNKNNLIIGIVNPEPKNTVEFKEFSLEKNPFTFWERYRMIRESLIDEKIDMKRIIIIPNYPSFIFGKEKNINFEPERNQVISHLNIVTDWDKEKIKIHEKEGYTYKTTNYVFKVKNAIVTASEVRRRIKNNGNWEELLPKAVVKIIKEVDGINRIKQTL